MRMSGNISSPDRTNLWLADVFRHLPDPVVLRSDDGTVANANAAFAKLAGVPLENLTGKQFLDLVAPDSREKWIKDLDRLAHGEWTMAVAAYDRIDGRSVPVEVRIIGRTVCGGTQADILHFQDISICRNVERALAASQMQWELSFDAIPDLMCILDSSGKILRINRAMTLAFQHKHPDIIGMDYRTIFRPIPQENSFSQLADAIGAAPFTVSRVSFSDLDGCFTVSAFPIKDMNDVLSGSVFIARDIAEHLKTRDELQKSRKSLRRGAKTQALGHLAGGIAHDFNNMMAPIVGFSSLLLKTMKQDDPMREWVQEIADSAKRATVLASQLKELSHGHSIKVGIVDLSSVIRNMRDLLRTTVGSGIEVLLCLADSPWKVKADISRLERVVMNLAVNAREAMPNGGTFSIKTSNMCIKKTARGVGDNIPPGSYVLAEFSDTGCGMSEKVRKHAFDAFFSTKEEGTGLGLSTVYGIVTQFGGHIRLSSELNEGTRFSIYLPRSEKNILEVTQNEKEPES